MDFPLPVASGSFTSISIGMGIPENGGIAVEIMSLSCIAADQDIAGVFFTAPPPPPLATYVRKIGLATRKLIWDDYYQALINQNKTTR